MSEITLNRPLIDWITLSVVDDARKRVLSWCSRRRGGGRDAKRKMDKAWYVGFEGDGFFYGEAEQKGRTWGIFMCEGEIAHPYAHELWGMVLGRGANCTRIDMQVTIMQPKAYDPYRFRESIERVTGMEAGTTGKRSAGVTVELNSRSSTRYSRIYEKIIYRQKKEEGYRLLRMEFEYKGDLAEQIWLNGLEPAKTLRAEIDGLTEGSEYANVILGQFWPYLGDVSKRARMVRKSSNTWDWIDSTVRSSFLKIIEAHDSFERGRLKMFLLEQIEIIDIREMRDD